MSAVARKGDSVNTGHSCDSSTQTKECSSDVIVNGKGAVRKGDALETHTIKQGNSCVPHSSKVNVGSGTVFVNGKPLARTGDSADSGSISSGSGNVFAG